jgi:hypothetical protein
MSLKATISVMGFKQQRRESRSHVVFTSRQFLASKTIGHMNTIETDKGGGAMKRKG